MRPPDQARADFQAYVINLDRSPQRLAVMAQRLAAYGIGWERVAAVEGRLLDVANHPGVSPAGYRRMHGRELLASEVGCYLSHISACRQFLASTHAYAAIFEDDADFLDDPRPVLAALMAQPSLWDVAKLSGIHRGMPVRLADLPGQRKLCVTLSRYTGANAYVLNRRAAQCYIQHLLPMVLPYDLAFDQAWRHGVKLRAVFPPVCAAFSADTPSTIVPPVRQLRLPWFQRGPTYLYRAGSNARRLAHGLGVVLAHRWARK